MPAFKVPLPALVGLSAAAFCSALSLRLTDPLLPLLARDFAVSPSRAAAVITAFSVAYGIAQLCFGPVGDRFGKYRVIAGACIACACTATLCGLAQGFTQLITARLLAGATAAAIIPLSIAWIGDVIKYDRRQPILARFLIGQILGLSSGVAVGGYAAEHLGWQLPFFGVGLLFLAIGVLLFAIDRRLPAEARRQGIAAPRPIARMAAAFADVLARPWARVVLLTVFLEGACVFGAFAFMATHLHRIYDLPLATAGLVAMLFGFGGVLYAVAAAALVRRLGEVGLTAAGSSLMAGAFLTIALAPTWRWAIPACFVAGLGFYMLHNTLQTQATQMAPQARGAAVSAFASCFYLGQSAGVALAGAWLAGHGTSGVIAAGAAGVWLVGLGFSLMRSRHGPASDARTG